MLKQGKLDGDETAAWQTVVSVLRRNLMPALGSDQQMRAEDLFGQARVVIGEAIQHAQSIRQGETERQNRLLRDLGQALITTFDVEKLADVLADQLPTLGIHSCYLALYERPEESLESARLVLAYTDSRRASLEKEGRSFRTLQFVPPDLLPKRRFSFVVEPLYFQHEALGFIVFEVGPQVGDVYEVLRGHISSALKGALLFQDANKARQVAERADQVKTRLLANVSHELRTPLNIIIGHAQRILIDPPPDLETDLEDIHHSAEHQLRIINDLLDLSRAEINALDLYPVMLDPKPLLAEAFTSFSKDVKKHEVPWCLEIPEILPTIEADPVRLRQVLLNLLSNAAKFTERGQITLGAEHVPPHLHIWVSDTGIGIPPETVDRIYEPFYTNHPTAGGIGLGLSITKHLINLHNGLLEVESQPGEGSIFHIYLPLPNLDGQNILLASSGDAVLWLISNAEEIPTAIGEFSQSRELSIWQIKPQPEIDDLFASGLPSVVAWDMSGTHPEDWVMIRRLHNHPRMAEIPFILFQGTEGGTSTGLTSVVVKPASNQALWDSIRPAIFPEKEGSILIIDDDPHARQTTYDVVKNGLPDYAIRTAEDGKAGLDAMLVELPSLVILDLMMPNMNGFEVLDRMREDERTRKIPVVILSNRQLTFTDIQRLERHADVILQSKGILSDNEIIASLHYSLFDSDTLPPQTSALVKKAIAYFHQNYPQSITRMDIADAIGVNQDYLTRVFKQELGISPWDYLNRYRIYQAKELLVKTHKSVSQIADQIGFSDQAYFSRVFRKLTGISPTKYRDQT
jgi:signal transduction histidine kinase/AraC-like DNA-binding protein